MIALKKLSFWASNHKWQSWLIIAFLHFLLIVSAIFLANAAFFSGISLNLYWLFALIGILTIVSSVYPLKNTKSYSFKNRKRADFALVTSGFFLIFSLFNVMISEYEIKTTTANPYAVQTILKSPSTDFENDSRLTKFRKKIKRRSYQRTQQFKAFWKTQNDAVKVLLILLTLAVAVVLAIVVTYLGCAIACSSSSGWAAAVFIIGYLGILVGAFFAIRAIVRMGKKTSTDKDSAN